MRDALIALAAVAALAIASTTGRKAPQACPAITDPAVQGCMHLWGTLDADPDGER